MKGIRLCVAFFTALAVLSMSSTNMQMPSPALAVEGDCTTDTCGGDGGGWGSQPQETDSGDWFGGASLDNPADCADGAEMELDVAPNDFYSSNGPDTYLFQVTDINGDLVSQETGDLYDAMPANGKLYFHIPGGVPNGGGVSMNVSIGGGAHNAGAYFSNVASGC